MKILNMKMLLYCCVSLLLLACSSSSMKRSNVSLFDTITIRNSPNVLKIIGIFNKKDGIRTTKFEHPPIHNPNGTQFTADQDFVKKYNLYKKHTNRKEHSKIESKDINIKEIDEFALYKLIGAKKVDTSSANWDVDYIPNIRDKLITNSIDEKNNYRKGKSIEEIVNIYKNTVNIFDYFPPARAEKDNKLHKDTLNLFDYIPSVKGKR